MMSDENRRSMHATDQICEILITILKYVISGVPIFMIKKNVVTIQNDFHEL